MIKEGITQRNTHFDDTYDELADPDYTISNTMALSSDEDDDEDEFSQDEKEFNDSETAASIPDDEENANGVKSKRDKFDSSSLAIHKRFHYFIHKHEVPRKVLHSGIGFMVLVLHCYGYKTSRSWQPVLPAAICILLLDFVRFRFPGFQRAYCAVVGFLMREKELQQINGVVWYQLGLCIAFLIHKQDIAIMSILLLSWSDTAASTIGRAYGKYSPKISQGKSLIGSVAAFFTGVIACYLFYGYIAPNWPLYGPAGGVEFEYDPEHSKLSLGSLALASGFAAAVSEGIDVFGIDDNFTIPVISGLLLKFIIVKAKC